MKIGSILFPVFNWGQAILISFALGVHVLGAIFVDLQLALEMAIGSYVVIVLYMFIRDLAPDEAEIQKNEVGPISDLLANELFIYPVNDRVWAPARSRSWLFKSDWISINENKEGKLILKARRRDLKIIMSAIRPDKATRQLRL